MLIRPYIQSDQGAVIQLWQECGLLRPWNDPQKDIARKLTVQPELFLVGVVDANIIASIMAGYDGHRGWINYLAVSPDHRRLGHGENLVRHVERLRAAAGCPKSNLQVRTTNHDAITFYQRIGYVQDDAISLGKRMIADEPV